jgi:hypothetical protein
MGSAIQTQTRMRLRKPVQQAGSLDRRSERSSSHSALSPLASTRDSGVDRLLPVGHDARDRVLLWLCNGRIVPALGPATRTAKANEALRDETSVMPGLPRSWTPGADIPPRASSVPMPSGPSCWRVEHQRGAAVIVPPRSDAVLGDTAGTAPTQRDRHLKLIAKRGRMVWQKASGYNRRALVEANISRYKRVIGGALRSQTDGRQATEMVIAVDVLNRMLEIGRPESVRIV